MFSALIRDPAVQHALGEVLYQIGTKAIPVDEKSLKRLQKKNNRTDFLTLVDKAASRSAKTKVLQSKRGSGLLEVLRFALPFVATLLG